MNSSSWKHKNTAKCVHKENGQNTSGALPRVARVGVLNRQKIFLFFKVIFRTLAN